MIAQMRRFEDFTVGDVYRSAVGRTVTETDNLLFTMLSMNTNELHFNEEAARATEWGQPLVNSAFTLALVLGLSVRRHDPGRRRQPRLDGDPAPPPGLRRRHAPDPRRRCGVRAPGRGQRHGIVCGAHARPEPARRGRVRVRPQLPDPEGDGCGRDSHRLTRRQSAELPALNALDHVEAEVLVRLDPLSGSPHDSSVAGPAPSTAHAASSSDAYARGERAGRQHARAVDRRSAGKTRQSPTTGTPTTTAPSGGPRGRDELVAPQAWYRAAPPRSRVPRAAAARARAAAPRRRACGTYAPPAEAVRGEVLVRVRSRGAAPPLREPPSRRRRRTTSTSQPRPYRRSRPPRRAVELALEPAAEQLLEPARDDDSASTSMPVRTPSRSSCQTRSSVATLPVAFGENGQPPSPPTEASSTAAPAVERGPGRGVARVARVVQVRADRARGSRRARRAAARAAASRRRSCRRGRARPRLEALAERRDRARSTSPSNGQPQAHETVTVAGIAQRRGSPGRARPPRRGSRCRSAR